VSNSERAISLNPEVAFDIAVSSLATAAIFAFMVFFASGFGPCVWIYLSDIYPSEIKGSCISAAIMVNWLFSAIVVFGLGAALSNPTTTYSLFTGLNICGFAFIAKFIVLSLSLSISWFLCPLISVVMSVGSVNLSSNPGELSVSVACVAYHRSRCRRKSQVETKGTDFENSPIYDRPNKTRLVDDQEMRVRERLNQI